MTDDPALDVTAQIPLLVAVQSAVHTAVGGPMLQGLAMQVQAAVLSIAGAPPRSHPPAEGEWFALKGDDHLSIAGPDLTITATLAGGQVQTVHVDSAGRSLQCDFGNPASRVTSTGLLDAAGEGLGAVAGRLKEAATGQIEGALGRVRVRIGQGHTTIADWSFDPGGMPVDNQDVEGQIAKAEAEFERDLARAGPPGETPNTDATGIAVGGATGGDLAGAVGAAAAAAAMAATQRLVRRAIETRQQPEVPEKAPEPARPVEPAPEPPAPAELPSFEPTRDLAGDDPPKDSDRRCESCGESLDEADRFCPACGTSVANLEPAPALAPTCRSCGSDLEDGARFCAACGAPVDTSTPVMADQTLETAVQEWCYVTAPVAIRSVADTSQPGGWLQPGIWYLADEETNGWVLVTEPDSGLQGWAPATGVSYQRAENGQTLESTRQATWSGTHTVPASGLPAWAEPDPNRPAVANVDGGLPVDVVERRGDWALIRASNQWEGWVDGRQLIKQ